MKKRLMGDITISDNLHERTQKVPTKDLLAKMPCFAGSAKMALANHIHYIIFIFLDSTVKKCDPRNRNGFHQ